MSLFLERSHLRSSTAQTAVTDAHTDGSPLPKDEQLAIARTLEGDVDAFNALVHKYQRLAYSVAYRTLQTAESAGDAVQESFLKAFRALPSFDGTSFKGWLMRIVVNTCHDILRQKSHYRIADILDEIDEEEKWVSHELVDPNESPAAFIERMELHAQIELGCECCRLNYG